MVERSRLRARFFEWRVFTGARLPGVDGTNLQVHDVMVWACPANPRGTTRRRGYMLIAG